MLRLLLRRVGLAVLSLWGVATIVFLMTKLIPGDVARAAAGRYATTEQIEAVRQSLGLDQPVPVQYFQFLARALQGDLGSSAYSFQPITDMLAQVLPMTVQLVALGMLVTIIVAIPLGVIAAVNEGRAGDVASRAILVFAGGVPVFWFAIMARWIFGALLGWAPISGSNSIGMAPPRVTGFTLIDSLVFGTPMQFFDSLSHLALPAIALSLPFVANLARNVRSNMLTALRSDYVGFAAAKGVSFPRIVIKHALRASIGAILTLIGMQIGWMISSAVLVETVFSLQGVGTMMYNAIVNQDTFAVLGAVLVIGTVFIITAFLVDFAQMLLDPRIRRAQVGAS